VEKKVVTRAFKAGREVKKKRFWAKKNYPWGLASQGPHTHIRVSWGEGSFEKREKKGKGGGRFRGSYRRSKYQGEAVRTCRSMLKSRAEGKRLRKGGSSTRNRKGNLGVSTPNQPRNLESNEAQKPEVPCLTQGKSTEGRPRGWGAEGSLASQGVTVSSLNTLRKKGGDETALKGANIGAEF